MKHLLPILLLVCTCKALWCQSVLERPTSYSYFTIGITDGDVFNGIGGFGRITKPIEDRGPGISPYLPRYPLNLSLDFTRVQGKHSIGLSYLPIWDSYAGITFVALDLDYGYQLLHSNHFSLSAETGLMYGTIIGSRVAVKLGLRSYTKLYKSIYLNTTFTAYHKLRNINTGHRGSVMLTAGLAYRFTEKSQQAILPSSPSDTP